MCTEDGWEIIGETEGEKMNGNESFGIGRKRGGRPRGRGSRVPFSGDPEKRLPPNPGIRRRHRGRFRVFEGIARLLPTLTLILLTAGSLSAADRLLWTVSVFNGDDYFYQPSDMAADRERDLIYVVETGNHRVSVFDFEGKFIRTFGKQGQGPGEFAKPTGAALLENGDLAVADVGNNRIQIFDRRGRFLRSIGTHGRRAADLAAVKGEFITIPSFGNSGYALHMDSEENFQPLATVLDGEGEIVRVFRVEDFPDSHPFIRAIKHRVALAVSPDGRLFLPYFAINRTLVFDITGKEAGRFERPLAFKPREPKLEEQRSREGVIQMRASMDFISQAAQFGADGCLYILTFAGSIAELLKGVTNRAERPRPPMRIDVIDPDSYKTVRRIDLEPGAGCFTVLDRERLAYIHEDEAGEPVLVGIRF